MINRLNKNKVKNFFNYYGWFCLVILVIIYGGWYWIISAINVLGPDEQINIFIESFGLTDHPISENMQDALRDDGILEINFYNYRPDDEQLTSYYDRFGASSDLLILRDNDLEDMQAYIKDQFMTIDEAMMVRILNNCQQNYTYYTYDDSHFALKIYDCHDELYNNQFTYESFIQFNADAHPNHDYYLLFNKKSYNFGSANENYLSEIGFKAANIFLKEFEK